MRTAPDPAKTCILLQHGLTLTITALCVLSLHPAPRSALLTPSTVRCPTTRRLLYLTAENSSAVQ